MIVNSGVSVVIVNYNAGDQLLHCVRSAFESEGCDEVIVVDNDSRDNSLDLLLTAYSEGAVLRVLRNAANFGFAKACNQGTQIARGRYLLYLNPDAVLERDSIAILRGVMEKDREAGMAGGLIMNADGSEQAGCRRTIPTPWRSFVRAFGLYRLKFIKPDLLSDFICHLEPLPERNVEVEAISGACMMVSRDAIAAVGPLDEEYFLHCEDLDWCMRMRQKRWKVLFVPAAKLKHSKGGCSGRRPLFVEWQKHKGMIRFYNKFFRRDYPGVLMGLVFMGVGVRFIAVASSIVFNRLIFRFGAGHG
ncbi:MAG: glycosyltransferase family 2 protein [Gammaproteobacteria bacterium]